MQLQARKPCCAQALNIDFNLMSASDPNYKCLNVISSNFKFQMPTHWFRDLKQQISCGSCFRHPFATSSCDPCPVHADIGICGTPCHPYSTQRAGRFQAGSVEKHHECDVALKDFLDWLLRFQPSVQIFEQVLGFTMPFQTGSSETPMDRLPSFNF